MFHDVIGTASEVIVEQLVIGVEAMVQRLIFGNGLNYLILEFAHTLRGFVNARIRASGDGSMDSRTKRGRLRRTRQINGLTGYISVNLYQQLVLLRQAARQHQFADGNTALLKGFANGACPLRCDFNERTTD